MRVLRLISSVALLAVLSAGCSDQHLGGSDVLPPSAPVGTSTPPTPPASNAHLVNAFDYVAHPPAGTRYYFTSPSGAWACAIVPRDNVGCQSTAQFPYGIGITDAPDSVSTAAGTSNAPNALVLARDGEPRFLALEESEFALTPKPATALPFNRILAVAGFRCNVQEQTGVSCLSETSGKGFTFSPDGFVPQYTDVPADAP
jgi:hypothetical protein